MESWIELEAADGHRLKAYVATASAPRGAVVIAQEVFGVNRHIRDVARRYADLGYTAIAPAFFDRIEPGIELGYERPDVERGLALTRQLAWPGVMLDVDAAVKHAATSGAVGIIGYCWGGTTTWLASARVGGLSCAVCYYGGGIPAHVGETPRCPVALHWGERDPIIPTAAAEEVTRQHPSALSYFYPTDHGFNCDLRDAYHAESAQLAQRRTLEFLGRHLSTSA